MRVKLTFSVGCVLRKGEITVSEHKEDSNTNQ